MLRRPSLWIWIGLLLPVTVQAQDAGRLRFVHWAYQDAGAYVQDIGVRAPFLAVGGAVVLAPTSGLDPSVLEEVQEGYHGPFASYLNLTNNLGGRRMPAVVAGVFAASLVTPNTRFQDAAFTSLQSLAYAGAVTGALKNVIGRFRPEVGDGAYRFAPLSGNTSFPSGHTTAVFAIITPWVHYYPNAATYGLFALGTGTAVARIALDKHWPTDVMTGAAIGFFTGRYLARRHQKQSGEPPRLLVQPLVGSDGAGLSLQLCLDRR